VLGKENHEKLNLFIVLIMLGAERKMRFLKQEKPIFQYTYISLHCDEDEKHVLLELH
jgi:hypothetical protein